VGEELAIIGITRFSVVERGPVRSFSRGKGREYEDRYRYVFDRHRMRRRFRLFEALALPSVMNIARQYKHFRYVILISSNLPLRWKLRLRWITRGLPWCRVVTVDRDGGMGPARRKATADFAGARRYFCFRLDDDDALAGSWLSVVLDHARKRTDDFVLSCDDGIYLQKDAPGSVRIAPMHYPRGAFGLGLFSRDPNGRTIYCLGNHTKVDRAAEVVHFGGRPCWIRALHRHSESRTKLRDVPPVPLEQAEQLLSPEFGHIDLRKGVAAL